VLVDMAWYVIEASDRAMSLIAALEGAGTGKSKRPSRSCAISTENRWPRRTVNEVDEMSPAQDPAWIAAWSGAETVYGIPQVVTLGDVRVLAPQPATVTVPTASRQAIGRTRHIAVNTTDNHASYHGRPGGSCRFDRLEKLRLG
jgi:hypothetical protein